jgi:hypothetical protein
MVSFLQLVIGHTAIKNKAEECSGGAPLWRRWKDTKNMNTRPLELLTNVESSLTETDVLTQSGFTQDEIISLLWLRQWYQHGGSDRMPVVRHLEFLKILVGNGKIES